MCAVKVRRTKFGVLATTNSARKFLQNGFNLIIFLKGKIMLLKFGLIRVKLYAFKCTFLVRIVVHF